MPQISGAQPRRYHAIVFRDLPPSPDFSQAAQIVLPGQHTQEAAWAAIRAALGGQDGRGFIGGEIRACVTPIAVG